MIKEGDHVIIVDNSSNRLVLKVRSKKIKYFKAFLDLSQLINKRYGQHFQIIDNKSGLIQQITDQKLLVQNFFLDQEDDVVQEEAKESLQKDNRDIIDNNLSQKLTEEEITKMKQEGISGDQLISKIIENSETFNKRTKFSQAKYIKKKQAKYQIRFEVRKPNSLELCETYSQTAPNKICGLRFDSLALILNLANVNYNSRVLLVDKTKGLISGALIEREVQSILKVEFSGSQIKVETEILLEFGFHPYQQKRISYINYKQLLPSKEDPFLANIQKNYKKSFNSVIIVHEDFHVKEMYEVIRDYIQPSASIVLFSQFLQPLTELQEFWVKEKDVINIRLEELWMREQQVLPLRTHPFMNMHGASGFVLSAMKVA